MLVVESADFELDSEFIDLKTLSPELKQWKIKNNLKYLKQKPSQIGY